MKGLIIKQYKLLVADTPADLAKTVDFHLREGWVLYKKPLAWVLSYTRYGQAVILPNNAR